MASGDWYAVIFNPLAGNSSYKVIEGLAEAQGVQSEAVNGQLIGPYATSAAATSAAESEVKSENTTKPKAVSIPGVSQLDSGVNAVGDFFNKLSDGNLWIRIAEGLLGLLLVGIAMGKLTGVDQKITQAVSTAAKVVK
jgi:hypothetical protein